MILSEQASILRKRINDEIGVMLEPDTIVPAAQLVSAGLAFTYPGMYGELYIDLVKINGPQSEP